MYGGNMIAVRHVIRLNFPVVITNVSLRTFNNFQPVGGLVRKQINEKFSLTKVLLQGWNRIHQGAENKSAVGF